MKHNKKGILTLTVLVEGGLIVIALLWAYVRKLPLELAFTPDSFFLAAAFALPPIVLNFVCFFGPFSNRPFFQNSKIFVETIIKPLARDLDIYSCFFVSCVAGFSEELFFRGVLLTEIGIFASSIVFVLLHLGISIMQYRLIALFYFLISVYISYIYLFSSLFVVMALHAIYDFILFLYLKHHYTKISKISC